MKQKPWFTIKKVCPHVFAIAEFHHFEKVVSYVVVGKTRAVLFDTGMGYGDIFAVLPSITDLPVSVFLTHGHWDHIGGLPQVATPYIFDHPFEKTLLKAGFYADRIPELASKKYFQSSYVPKKYRVKPHRNFVSVKDNQVLKIDDFSISVIHTPGHTPGSACYFIPELNVLIVGDMLYPGPLYAQMPEANVHAYARSLTRLCSVANSTTRILPGHNAVESKYTLLKNAAVLMNKVIHAPKKRELKAKGKGFSILLPRVLGKKI